MYRKSFRTKRLEAKRNAMTVNGEHRQARTERGILRCVAQMVYAKITVDRPTTMSDN